MIITASSACSSIRMNVLGHADPFTVTERPLDKASVMRDEQDGGLGWSSSRADNGGSSSRDESMNVADTDVISRTERQSIGRRTDMMKVAMY